MDAKQRITKEQMKKTEQWWDGKYKYPENPSHFHNFVTHLAESYLDMLEEHERATDIRQYLQDKYTQLREENERLREDTKKAVSIVQQAADNKIEMLETKLARYEEALSWAADCLMGHGNKLAIEEMYRIAALEGK